MMEKNNILYTCQYDKSNGTQKSLQNTIQQLEDNQQNQVKLPTTNPKIKFIPMQNQQQQVNQLNQPQQINQTNYSNQQNYDLSQTTINNQSIFQTNLNMDQTIFQTKTQMCKYCTKNITNESIILSCFHTYHKECLNELIESNINIEQPTILCMCKIRIPQCFILKLIQDKQLRKRFFFIQLCEMISKAPLQVQQSLLGEKKYHPQTLKNILNQLMVEDDTPQKIHQN